MKPIHSLPPAMCVLFWSVASGADQNQPPQQFARHQLILKHDFERVDSIANWKQEIPKTGQPHVLVLDATGQQAHSGWSALKFEFSRSDAGSRSIYTGAKIEDGGQISGRLLRLRMYARTENTATQNIRVRLLERNENGVIGWLNKQENWLTITPSKEWRMYEKTDSLAASTKAITLYIAVEKPIAEQKVWLDDISLEVLPPTAK